MRRSDVVNQPTSGASLSSGDKALPISHGLSTVTSHLQPRSLGPAFSWPLCEALDLHFSSVKYQVGRAVARRGREIGSDRLDVELALLVCHWYGGAGLQPDTP